jgi:hypothetical protein
MYVYRNQSHEIAQTLKGFHVKNDPKTYNSFGISEHPPIVTAINIFSFQEIITVYYSNLSGFAKMQGHTTINIQS